MIFVGNSSFIFKVKDLKRPKLKLVAKISSNSDEMSTEVKTLIKINKIQKENKISVIFPKVIEFGMISVNDET